MFVDTRINTCTCTHKTRQNCNSLSLLPFQENCLLFFALFYSLLFLKFERGGGVQPPYYPLPLDPPMTCTFVPANPFSRISFCAYINFVCECIQISLRRKWKNRISHLMMQLNISKHMT